MIKQLIKYFSESVATFLNIWNTPTTTFDMPAFGSTTGNIDYVSLLNGTKTFVSGNYGRISISTNYGSNFSKCTGLPNTTSASYTNVAHLYTNRNIYVTVRKDTGQVYTSSDGIDWTLNTLTGSNGVDLYGCGRIDAGNGLFVATGYNNHIYTSPDDINWTWRKRYSDFYGGNNGTITDVYFVNNKFFIMGSYNIVRSNDGITYYADSLYTGTYNSNNIVYANGKYTVGCSNGKIFNSTDGINFTEVTSGLAATGSSAIKSLTFGNGKYYAVTGATPNKVLVSIDAITWTAKDKTSFFGGLTTINGMYYVGSNFYGIGSNNTLVTLPTVNS